MNIQLPFGLRDGKLLHIASVESGLACNCICPSCGERLVAKKGEIVEHHFAHHNDLECEGAFETALHIYAKNILERRKRIILPPVYLDGTKRVLFPATEAFFEKVILEKRLNNIVPDLIVYIKAKPLLIEVAVSHFVDKIKVDKILELGYAAIEIDVRLPLNKTNQAKTINADFERLLIEETNSKKWINNLKQIQFNEELKKDFKLKKVIQTEYGKHKLIVDNCPVNKRVWKSGYKKGQSYASVEDDCWSCPFGEIIRNQKYINNGMMVNEGKIREVKCNAHTPKEIDDFISGFKNTRPKL